MWAGGWWVEHAFVVSSMSPSMCHVDRNVFCLMHEPNRQVGVNADLHDLCVPGMPTSGRAGSPWLGFLRSKNDKRFVQPVPIDRMLPP